MSRPIPPAYKTRNWPAYNEALKRRGSLTIWFDPEMNWEAAPTGKRGRQRTYSDAAVQTCLSMKVLFGMALRQTTGFVERLQVRATLDRVAKGQALAELYVPDWIAAQEEFLSVRRMQGSDMAALVAARPQMIAMLDTFRDKLEDLGGDLGVTEPWSGEAVVERVAEPVACPQRRVRPSRPRWGGRHRAAGSGFRRRPWQAKHLP